MSIEEQNMNIEEQNIQRMIKMIIDKLHNKTLKEYYEKLSKEQKGEIARNVQTITGQKEKIKGKDQEIAAQKGEIREIRDLIKSREAEIESTNIEIEGLRATADGDEATKDKIIELTLVVGNLEEENRRLEDLFANLV